MRPTSAFPFFRSLLITAILFFPLQPAAAASAQPLIHPAAIQTGLAAAASGCQWTYYPIKNGKLQPEQLLYNDPDNTPIANLSLGSMFLGKSTHLTSTGSADFDGDNKTDVFRTVPRSDTNLQWQYSSGGAGPWQDLAYASPALPVNRLQFGEFNGDTQSDVFASLYDVSLPGYQWMYSPDGTQSFVNLSSTDFYPDRLTLGDFNGDGVTDVFIAKPENNTEQWYYTPSGYGPPVKLAFAATDPALLRFGDFDGDGKTDVFTGVQEPDGSTGWEYSNGGVASFNTLDFSSLPYSDLLFGDFNGDGKTDVIAPVHQSDGSLDIQFWSGGTDIPVSLGRIPAPAPALRVGDFNGDGISDLFAYRCGMKAPLSFTARQTLATYGYSTFYKSFSGDVNGDGLQDVILVSTCQNPSSSGFCPTHHLQVGASLGTRSHTNSLVAPQQLGADNLDFTYYKVLAGDYDGDGKTDLALIDVYANSDTSMIIYVARSNGDGTFTLGAPQVFAGAWYIYNPAVGNFNGDGRDDLVFTAACEMQTSSCSVGDNNSVYVAMSSGAGVFAIGARQDLGPVTGWEDYNVYTGDFNGDGKTDLVFNNTCQRTNYIDSTCTIGDANLVYTALSTGNGSFTLSPQQNYGSSGWGDYPSSIDLIGDVNGDGRTDLVWSSPYQNAAKTNNNLVVVGMANPDGTFQLGSVQDFGAAWSGRPFLADLNHDKKADLVWNKVPLGDTDVDTYAAAISNGNGSFENLGPGAVDTGLGYFSVPDSDSYSKLPPGLTVLSTRQDSISSALLIVNGAWQSGLAYLPFVRH